MKNTKYFSAFLLTLLLSLQSCAVVGGIFKAGTITGIVIVVAILAVIGFVIAGFMKK